MSDGDAESIQDNLGIDIFHYTRGRRLFRLPLVLDRNILSDSKDVCRNPFNTL